MSNPFYNDPQPVALTVSQLNRQARNLLESHFDFVWVEGEVSNFVAPSSGHWYFSLKDGNAQVRCAMFRGRNQRLRFTPDNGDHIRLRGRVSLYEGRGEFQFGYLRAQMDCRATVKDGKPTVEFTWEGFDEMEPESGDGWATMEGDRLVGVLTFHDGERSGFTAQRPDQKPARKRE